MKKKCFISIILIFTIFLVFSTNSTNAVFQIKPMTSGQGKVDTIGNWILNLRKMEETGGGLGLDDTINTNDLTSNLDTSNNLDIHMQKNTEYGATAILSASAYGNPSPIEDGQTTTGNKSGVYIFLNSELVSAGTLSVVENYANAHSKYKNIYTSDINAYSYVGDASKETSGWHGGATTWISNTCYHNFFYESPYSNTYPQYIHGTLLRARDSIFGFYGLYAYQAPYNRSGFGEAFFAKSHPSRPIIVCRTRNIKYKERGYK